MEGRPATLRIVGVEEEGGPATVPEFGGWGDYFYSSRSRSRKGVWWGGPATPAKY